MSLGWIDKEQGKQDLPVNLDPSRWHGRVVHPDGVVRGASVAGAFVKLQSPPTRCQHDSAPAA